MLFRNRGALVLKVKRHVPYFDGERRRYTVGNPEFEYLTGWVHADSIFPTSAIAAEPASAAADYTPE
eukprot:4509829-Lingulodinium_polyedra.AAC.1